MSIVNLGIEVNGKNVYATPTGIRLNAKGKVTDPGTFLGALPKGDARKIRKALRHHGHVDKAAAKRCPA